MTWIRNLASKLNGRGAPTRAPVQPTPILRREKRAALKAPDFPGFQSSASDELAPGASDDIAQARVKLRQAYTPAQPIRDRRLFAGRRGVLGSIIRAIEDERAHTIIYGPRGIGKTSMLHVVAQAARDARYVVSYISCGSTTSFDEMFRALASEISVMYHADYGPTSAEAEQGATVVDLLPTGPISPRLASDICSKVVGTRVLVVVDEFDRGESAEFQRNMTEFLKNLSDRSVRVQMLIAGVAEELGDLLEPGVLTHRNVVALEITKMSADELRDLILMGAGASGVNFADDALDLVVEAANGLPYLASLLAQHASITALSAGRLNVAPLDVQIALGDALNEMRARMPRTSGARVSRLVQSGAVTPLGILAGEAQGANGRFTLASVRALAGKHDAGQLESLISGLARDGGLIRPDEEDNATFRFVDDDVLPYLWLLAVQALFQARRQVPEEGPGARKRAQPEQG